jgi:hypothetical protein
VQPRITPRPSGMIESVLPTASFIATTAKFTDTGHSCPFRVLLACPNVMYAKIVRTNWGQAVRIKMALPYGRMPMVCSLKTSFRCGGRARGLCPGWAFGGTEGRSCRGIPVVDILGHPRIG